MIRNEIISLAEIFTSTSPHNYIDKESAVMPEYEGMRIFESPIFAFGAAADGIYEEFKSPAIIGNIFRSPTEWLPGAKTVISFFLPYTDRIKSSNGSDFLWPSDEWLHGRYEGQIFLLELIKHIENAILESGYAVIVPATDNAYKSSTEDIGGTVRFVTNWSERHIAYACGLGTFGLSKGLITEKGMCGRFGSLITDLDYQRITESTTIPTNIAPCAVPVSPIARQKRFPRKTAKTVSFVRNS